MKYLLIISGITLGVIIIVFIWGNLRTKKIKRNDNKHEFEFLDLFYCNEESPNQHRNSLLYYIIRDIKTSKLYCICENNISSSTNVETGLRKYKETYVDYIPKTHFFNIKKNNENDININEFKEVKLYDKGSFWIDKEANNDYFVKHLKNLSKNYLGVLDSKDNVIQDNKLYNVNSKNDVSILDSVNFITGIIEFN